MAPKRSAPPPAVESSEELNSDSSSDESEEEIVESSPAARRNKATTRQKLQEPEASEEEEEEEDAEEEDEEEEEEEEADEQDAEEEEEEEEANHTAPPPATPNPPPPPANGVEMELDKEGEEEAPLPKSGRKRKAKKPAARFQRSWSKNDDVRILEVLAAYRREHNRLPHAKDIEADLAGKLEKGKFGRNDVAAKLKSLKGRYGQLVKNVGPPRTDTDRRVLELCKEIWGVIGKPKNVAAPVDFDQICASFPSLAGMMKKLDGEEPDLFKREFSLVDPAKARVLDQKIKKQRVAQLKLEQRDSKLMVEVTNALLELME